ncbi:MAG: hypothetical protein HY548_02150 [Elusimicrobia bacterium]|nr:hypothetical protein [Elusimicrobiota bacterium]
MSPDNPSVPERLTSLETKLDLVLQELAGLKGVLVEFQKSQNLQETAIQRHELELKIGRQIALFIFGPLFGALGVGAVLAIAYALGK